MCCFGFAFLRQSYLTWECQYVAVSGLGLTDVDQADVKLTTFPSTSGVQWLQAWIAEPHVCLCFETESLEDQAGLELGKL